MANTRIFARDSGDGGQYLVYSMQYSAMEELAMVLPLPTPPAPAEDAVQFIDLSGYAEFFDDASSGFEWLDQQPEDLSQRTLSSLRDRLVVHSVGDYEASFIPRSEDFSRLDPRFRLSDQVLGQLPQYTDWSFCVFRLKDGARKVHPMAFRFPRRDALPLFFPTLHVHDATIKPWARFNHTLYCQRASPPSGWAPSLHLEGWEEMILDERPFAEKIKLYDAAVKAAPPYPARNFMDIAKAKGVVAADQVMYRHKLDDLLKNQDTFL